MFGDELNVLLYLLSVIINDELIWKLNAGNLDIQKCN